MEETRLKDKFAQDFSRERDDDMISRLPDSLISHILLYLPTKKAVRTCVLSKRWKCLYLLIPRLDLKSNVFPNFNALARFMNKFLDFSRVHNSCLHKLKLSIHNDQFDQCSLTRWIDFVATSKLKFLDVERTLMHRHCLTVMPISLYTCETLVYLRLHQVLLSNFESVSLPRLKTMHLEKNMYAHEAVLESLISSCTVLEDLKIGRMFDDNAKVLRVRSKTLTSLSIKHYPGGYFRWLELEVFIDTPNLKYLNFEDEFSKSKTICELSSLTKASFIGGLYPRDSVDPVLFTSMAKVRDMKISSPAFEFIQGIMPSPPQFCNLSSLEAILDIVNINKLPWFLASCPNLRSLSLDLYNLYHYAVTEEIRLSSVPHCLISSLEFVEIKSTDILRKDPTEMEVARYFLENSVILTKLVIDWRCSIREEYSVILKEALLALPRRSSNCEIVVCQ